MCRVSSGVLSGRSVLKGKSMSKALANMDCRRVMNWRYFCEIPRWLCKNGYCTDDAKEANYFYVSEARRTSCIGCEVFKLFAVHASISKRQMEAWLARPLYSPFVSVLSVLSLHFSEVCTVITSLLSRIL